MCGDVVDSGVESDSGGRWCRKEGLLGNVGNG